MASILIDQDKLQATLQGLSGRRNKRELMERIGRGLHADVGLRFRAGKAPDGTPWLPLKTRRGQPLRDTGRLQRSITWEANEHTATIGTNVIYARAHNAGVEGKLPQRQFLGLAQPQVVLINRIADRWMKEVLDGQSA